MVCEKIKGGNKNEVGKLTVMVQDILNIVKYTYNTQLDENSLNYERFVTHLRLAYTYIILCLASRYDYYH